MKLWLNGLLPFNLENSQILQVFDDRGLTSEVILINQNWISRNYLLILQFQVKEEFILINRIKIQFDSKEVSLFLIN